MTPKVPSPWAWATEKRTEQKEGLDLTVVELNWGICRVAVSKYGKVKGWNIDLTH